MARTGAPAFGKSSVAVDKRERTHERRGGQVTNVHGQMDSGNDGTVMC